MTSKEIKISCIFEMIEDELAYADAKYKDDPMVEAITGLNTIKCEVMELEREVCREFKTKDHKNRMQKEAIQVAAMAVKFLRDIC